MTTRVVPDGQEIRPAQRSGDWYPDPAQRADYRYFDGTKWTKHIEVDGVQTVDPVPLVGQPPLNQQPTLAWLFFPLVWVILKVVASVKYQRRMRAWRQQNVVTAQRT